MFIESVWLQDDFFKELLAPYISTAHREMYPDFQILPSRSTSTSRRQPRPPEVMQAIQEAVEASGITKRPVPPSSIVVGKKEGTGFVQMDEFLSPQAVAEYAKHFSNRYYHMLYNMATREFGDALEGVMDPDMMPDPPEQIVHPELGGQIWNHELPNVQEQYELLLHELEGLGVLNGTSPHPTKELVDGKWVPNADVKVSWGELLSGVTGLLGELETIYKAGYDAKGNYPDTLLPNWDMATRGYVQGVQTLSGSSEYSLSQEAFKHLQGMGFIDENAKWLSHQNFPVPEALIYDPETGMGMLPVELFAPHGASQQRPNKLYITYPLQKDAFRNAVLAHREKNPDDYLSDTPAGKWLAREAEGRRSGPFFAVDVPKVDGGPSKETPEQKAEREAKEEEERRKAAIVPEDPMETKIDQLVNVLYEGEGDDLDKIREHLREIYRMRDPKEVDKEWEENVAKPIVEAARRGEVIDMKDGHPQLDGEKLQNLKDSINSAYKEMNGHDMHEGELEGLTRSELTERRKKQQKDLSDHRHDKFVTEANDVSSLQDLSPDASRTDLLQQYRRLYHHAQKYQGVMDSKDGPIDPQTGQPKNPSPITRLRQLLTQVNEIRQQKQIPLEEFQKDVDNYNKKRTAQEQEVQVARQDELERIAQAVTEIDPITQKPMMSQNEAKVRRQNLEENFPVPPLYGDKRHLEEEQIQAESEVQKRETIMNFLNDPSEGGALSYINEDNIGANDFRYRTPEGNLYSWQLNDPGSPHDASSRS